MTRRPRDPRPPAWAYKLLARILPHTIVSRTILGDLHEEFLRFRPVFLRDAWYICAAAALAACSVLHRLTECRRSAPCRSGRSPLARATMFLHRDVPQAWRSLVRQPTYALAGVLTLALGVGATTAIVAVVYSSVLKPLPFAGAERVLRIGDRWGTVPPTSISSMTVANYLDLQERTRLLDGFAAYTFRGRTISGPQGARRVRALQVTPGFLAFLGLRPLGGRDLDGADADMSAAPVVLLTDGIWRQDFGADPAVVGRTVSIDLVPHLVVGIAPPEFTFVADPAILTPLRWSAADRADRRRRNIEGLARMAPGVSPEAALQELNAVLAKLAAEFPRYNSKVSVTGLTLHEWLVHRARPRLLLFAGAVILVLLVACVNVTNLLLARGESRVRELAVCAALGADRLALSLRVLAECAVLGLMGGAGGILVALWGFRLLVSAYAVDIPRAAHLEPDLSLFAIGIVVALGAALLAAVLPAVQTAPDTLAHALKTGTRSGRAGRQFARRSLVVAEIALAVVLVCGAALLLNSLYRLGRIELGVGRDGVLTFSLGLPNARYSSPGAVTRAFYEIVSDLQSIPGVVGAAAGSRQPLFGGTNGQVSVTGLGRHDLVELRAVTPGYFSALGMRIVSGRGFTLDDARPGRRNVVVNEAFVRRLIGAAEPIGRALSADGTQGFEIVGVVSDVREFGPESPPPPAAYWATGAQIPPWTSSPFMTLIVRAEGDPHTLLPAIRERLRARDADLAIDDVASLAELAGRRLGRDRRSAMSLIGLFAALTLALGAVGIYGVMAFTVQQRTREFGIRMALGASGTVLLQSIVREGMGLAAIGISAGLALALLLGRALSALLFEIRPSDPPTYIVVAGIVLAVSMCASAWPARRAARLAPVDALRHE